MRTWTGSGSLLRIVRPAIPVPWGENAAAARMAALDDFLWPIRHSQVCRDSGVSDARAVISRRGAAAPSGDTEIRMCADPPRKLGLGDVDTALGIGEVEGKPLRLAGIRRMRQARREIEKENTRHRPNLRIAGNALARRLVLEQSGSRVGESI